MSDPLRLVSESELARARVIESWLNTFESQLLKTDHDVGASLGSPNYLR